MKDKSRKTYRPDGASFEGESLLQTISFSPDSTGSFSQSYKCERFKDVHELQATHLPSVLPSGLYTGLAVLEPIKRPTIAEEHMFPYVDAMPCHKCEAITVEALLSPGGYRHGSLAVISVSAGYGCKICRLMVQEIDIRDLNRQEFLYEPIVLRLANSTGTAYCQDEVWIKVGGKGTAIMGLYTDDGNTASDWIPGRRLARRPDPNAAIQLIRRWMAMSLKNPYEYQNQPRVLPKRLIDVSQGDGSIVYLKDFSQTSAYDVTPSGLYISLSHRWDSMTPSVTTTTSNHLKRMDGIPTIALPQTFRDAIYVTRELGIQYIWIDSLCIVQDSVADWEEESAKMGTYYGSSWLTIGVGIESSLGCFGTREVGSDTVQYLKIASDDPECSVLYFTETTTTLSLGDDQESILRQRAWAFQEEVLSPRYLGFQPKQMFYRCGDYIHFEDGLLEWLHAPSSNRGVGEYPLKERDLQCTDWFHFVEDYSSRASTKAEDRLPALSGIAHMYQEVWKDRYLAGLWRKDLPRQLCWSKKYTPRPYFRTPENGAPTWSWAAVNGKVVIDSGNFSPGNIRIEVKHASVHLAGLDPLGAVKSGVIRLSGILRQGIRTKMPRYKGHLTNNVNSTVESNFFLLSADGKINKRTGYLFTPDTSDYPESINKLWYLNITPELGLALLKKPSANPISSKDTYERVGFIELIKRKKAARVDKLRNSPRRLIYII